MICMPHIPYLQNSVRGYAGSSLGSVIRMETSTSHNHYWDLGALHNISASDFSIAYNQSNPVFRINTSGTAHFYRGAAWGETTQGPSKGTIHLDPESPTDHYGGAITFGASDSGAGNTAMAGIYTRSDGSYGTKMYFATTDSYAVGSKTAMTIDHVGAVTINRSSLTVAGNITASSKLGVNGGFNALQGVAQFKGDVTMNRGSIIRWADNAGGTGEYIYSKSTSPYDVTIHSGSHDAIQCPNTGQVRLNHAGAQKFVTTSSGVTVTGNVTAGGFLYSSDRAFKKDIKPVENALETVSALQGVTYILKETEEESVGFIAQDVEQVVPELVKGEEGEKTVNYGQMVALLTEAIKEQQAQIESLKAEIAEMKSAN